MNRSAQPLQEHEAQVLSTVLNSFLFLAVMCSLFKCPFLCIWTENLEYHDIQIPRVTMYCCLTRSAVVDGRFYFRKTKEKYDKIQFNNLMVDALLFLISFKAIQEDSLASKRVLRAYKMMLDFYGMELANDINGTVRRCEKTWKERYKHLNKYACALHSFCW